MPNEVDQALREFVTRFLAANPTPSTEHDAQWPSPCEQGEPFTANNGEQRIHWQPVKRNYADDFVGVERALETPVHPDIKAYYGAYWSAHMDATAKDGPVSLLQLWNPEDGERLTENLLGHYLVQKRARAPLSFFFACTEEDSDLVLSLENATGRVLLERPGQKPLREVADSLAEFISGLAPVTAPSV